MPEIGLFEAIYSARSIRRLKPDPVPEELITKIVDAAIRAPSGGDAQSWAFVVVRDPDRRLPARRHLPKGLRQSPRRSMRLAAVRLI